jgi:uncharacterized protein
MDITPITPKGQNFIKAYGDGFFTIIESRYKGNILLFADEVISLPETFEFQEIVTKYLPKLLEKDIEILLIGTGPTHVILNKATREFLQSQKFSTDPMQTGAACRTYNILLSEGRSVAAIFFAVD